MDLRNQEDEIARGLREAESGEDSDDGTGDCSEVEENLETEIHYSTDDSCQSDSDGEKDIGTRRKRRRPCVIYSDEEFSTERIPTPESQGANAEQHLVYPGKRIVFAKNGHKWFSSPRNSSAHGATGNIANLIPGPVDEAKKAEKPIDIFSLFISDDIITVIVKFTNVEIQLKKANYKQEKSTITETSANEIRAIIGLLIQSAACKSNHLSTRLLFNNKYSGSSFKANMSAERFDFLLRCLRFDDKTTRAERKATDKFAPIRGIWELFINNCKRMYQPGLRVTIDEQLVGFRGHCPFRMYLPNKPNKYGIKIVMLADVETKYIVNTMPHLSKGTSTDGQPLASYFFKKLTGPLHGTNRNITMDNWFTSIPLALDLLEDPYKLTIVGTLRSNKREIPKELQNSKARKAETSMFCYDDKMVLLSFKPKPNKVVFVLSTAHDQPAFASDSAKPEMVVFYNKTKGAVDTVDQICSNQSLSRKTNRWPLCVFYSMLNNALINMYVIYVSNTIGKGDKPLNRRNFALLLSEQLMEPWLEERLLKITLPRNTRSTIVEILGKQSARKSRPHHSQYPGKFVHSVHPSGEE